MNHVSVFPSRTVICIEKHTELESLTIKFIILYIINIKAIDSVKESVKIKALSYLKQMYQKKYCMPSNIVLDIWGLQVKGLRTNDKCWQMIIM